STRTNSKARITSIWRRCGTRTRTSWTSAASAPAAERAVPLPACADDAGPVSAGDAAGGRGRSGTVADVIADAVPVGPLFARFGPRAETGAPGAPGAVGAFGAGEAGAVGGALGAVGGAGACGGLGGASAVLAPMVRGRRTAPGASPAVRCPPSSTTTAASCL